MVLCGRGRMTSPGVSTKNVMWWRWWRQQAAGSKVGRGCCSCGLCWAAGRAASPLTLAGKWHKIHAASSSLALLNSHIGTVTDDYTIFGA